MHESTNGEKVGITSNITGNENDVATLPIPALRSTVPKTNGEGKILQYTSPASKSSSGEEEQEASNAANIEPIYASIDPRTKSLKKSLDSGVGNPSLSRSPSQETVYSEPFNSSEETFQRLLNAHLTPPSYKTDGSQESFLSGSKKTNRFLQKLNNHHI